jgi:hypothetical protein
MNKYVLLTQIAALLDKSIEAHELTDLKLEEYDDGSLRTVNTCLEMVIDSLRRARRVGRLVLEQYEDDLIKKPEYIDIHLHDSIDEDDEDDDEEESIE